MRIRKDIVAMKADACRRGVYNGDHAPAWYTCVYCGHGGDYTCRIMRSSDGDVRRCAACGNDWNEVFEVNRNGRRGWTFVGVKPCE